MSNKIERPDYDGIIFYSASDLSTGSSLKAAEDRIDILISLNSPFNINQILEFHNIIKLFETNVKLEAWSSDYYADLKRKANKLKEHIGRYVSNFDYNCFHDTYNAITTLYVSSFWDMFEHYGMQNTIPIDTFKSLLYADKMVIHHVLRSKKIVSKFDQLISNYMLINNKGAEILINAYLVKHEFNNKSYYIPNSLTIDKKTSIINSYIESENPNPNYLEMIIKGKKCSQLTLSDRIRVAAKQRYDMLLNEIFSNNEGITFGVKVIFKTIEKFVIVDDTDCFKPSFTFSSSWVGENLDFPTLMNNFIFMFEFVDKFYRSSFPNNIKHPFSFESFVGLKSLNSYPVDVAFQLSQMIYTTESMAYDAELSKHNLRIEDLIEWFFQTYLKEEFNVNGFTYNSTSLSATYLEKTRLLCSEIDSIIKQFSIFVEDRYINQDLLEISSSTPLFSTVKSFCNNKFGYLVDKELQHISDIFFSNQSLLTYTTKTDDTYDTFYEMLCGDNITYDDFANYQQPTIDALLKKNFLFYSPHGILKFPKEKLIVLRDFFYNEVLCLTYYDFPYVDELIKLGKVKVENTLFSKPEYNYLDYILNDHNFDNGKQLRNRYIHGTNTKDENVHRQDYYQLLNIIILIVLKINEEFCRADDTWHTSNTNSI